MKKKLAILAAAALCLSGAAQAADTPETVNDLDPIVVTATRTVRNAMDTNANVEVLSGRTIETHHYSDLTEALRDVPGVSITRHSTAGFEQSDNILINGSKNVVVLIDGMRANLNGSTFSPFNYGSLKDMSNIERIEVVKGSASTLYGSDAKGGVINIITKRGSVTPKTTIGFETGSFGREQYRLSTTGKSGKVFYNLGYMKSITGDYKDGHGVKVPAHSNTTSWNAKFVVNANAKSDVTLAVERYTSNYDYQNFVYNYGTGSYDKKAVQHGWARDLNLRASWEYRFSDRMKNQLGIYTHQSLTNYNNWEMDLETIGVSDQFTTKLGKSNELIAGFDIFQEKMKGYDDGYGVYGEKYSDKSITTKAFYIQDRWDVTDQFNLTGGLRYTHHSKAGGNTSLAITAGYDANKKTNIYASYKQFFVAPNLYQYYSASYGNPDLKPEKGYTYEFGISHKFTDSFNAKFHIFHRKARDVISYVTTDPVTYAGEYQNIDEETANGWDISLNKAFNKNLSMNVGYTHMQVKPRSSGKESVNKLIPNGEWHIGLNYDDHKAWAASITGRGVIGRTGYVDNAFPKNTYWVWDVAVNYTFKPGIRLYVKANNIFNQYYAEFTNVSSTYSTPETWYSAPGRNFVVGLDFTF